MLELPKQIPKFTTRALRYEKPVSRPKSVIALAHSLSRLNQGDVDNFINSYKDEMKQINQTLPDEFMTPRRFDYGVSNVSKDDEDVQMNEQVEPPASPGRPSDDFDQMYANKKRIITQQEFQADYESYRTVDKPKAVRVKAQNPGETTSKRKAPKRTESSYEPYKP